MNELRPQSIRGNSCYNLSKEVQVDTNDLRPGTVRGFSCYLKSEDEESTEPSCTEGDCLDLTKQNPADESSSLDDSTHGEIQVELTSSKGESMRPSIMRGMSCYFDEDKETFHVLLEGKDENKEMPESVKVEGRRFQLKRHNSREDFMLDDGQRPSSSRIRPSWNSQIRAITSTRRGGRRGQANSPGTNLIQERLKIFEQSN